MNSGNFTFTTVDPRNYVWDEDKEYVQTTGKSHGFRDGYRITVTPVRMDGSPMNLGCHIVVKDGDTVDADFTTDALTMQLLAESIQSIMIEQTAARMID